MCQTLEQLFHDALDMAFLKAYFARKNRGQLMLRELKDQELSEAVRHLAHHAHRSRVAHLWTVREARVRNIAAGLLSTCSVSGLRSRADREESRAGGQVAKIVQMDRQRALPCCLDCCRDNHRFFLGLADDFNKLDDVRMLRQLVKYLSLTDEVLIRAKLEPAYTE